MNRIENIILTLATAAALLAASTANANPNPCPKTGNNNDRPTTRISEDPRDGLPGEPVVKTRTGKRLARDLELERLNRDSGTKPEDGLPGRPVVKTPTGTRTARDLETERANGGPCPEDKGNTRTRTAENGRTRTANEAGSLLRHNGPVLPDPNGTRTKDGELADRDQLMDSIKDAARRNKNKDDSKAKSTKNTTLDKALKRAGIDPKRLKGAKTETDKYGSTTITLADGTVITTGSDSDGLGTSVTSPNGDEINVFPDGRVSRRKGLNGSTITTHPTGTTTLYDPKQDTLTIVDKHGRAMTRPLDFYGDWNAKGWNSETILDLIDPLPGHSDPNNTTLDDALKNAGLSRDDLKDATSIKTSEYSDSLEITLKDGTVVWTGPNSDGLGSSVTKPNGDQVEVYTNGKVIKSNVKNP